MCLFVEIYFRICNLDYYIENHFSNQKFRGAEMYQKAQKSIKMYQNAQG
jgi:hypothetical protein